MAEAEDVVVDAARHTTVFMRELWRRHYPQQIDAPLGLASIAQRLDLLLTAACQVNLPLRVALPPARPTLLHRLVRRHTYPCHRQALPATNGAAIWLPADLGIADVALASQLYRAMALQQARRAVRETAQRLLRERDPLLRDTALVLEAHAAQAEVVCTFPGLVPAVEHLRRLALAARPPVAAFTPIRQPLESLARALLEDARPSARVPTGSVDESLEKARQLIPTWGLTDAERGRLGPSPLFRDWWTGELRAPEALAYELKDIAVDLQNDVAPVRSARMNRRPEEREATEDEDKPGGSAVWMVQQDAPHEAAEDPFGLQRPVDRDDQTSAEEYGDMLSEVASARQVAAPEPAREVLLSDDPPPSRAILTFADIAAAEVSFRYPEWDCASETYRKRGVTVRIQPPNSGAQAWVDATLSRHRGQLEGIRRQFEALRPERVRLRRQTDGEDIDLDACVEARADLLAGGFLREALYEMRRPGRRSIALSLLVDASGSTDGWIGGHHRVIDVEREALLLVSMALQTLGEPFAVLAFSGEGPHGVTLRALKDFGEDYSNEIALRIAALEPERYTRAGAAIRHATAMLMRQNAEHRLLMLLSDGKPNDADRYDGRYGVEDMRQSVIEARLQGIFPFCLTIDRQAPGYLPKVFGAHHYALLSTPERLPAVLLDWTRRLLAR